MDAARSACRFPGRHSQVPLRGNVAQDEPRADRPAGISTRCPAMRPARSIAPPCTSVPASNTLSAPGTTPSTAGPSQSPLIEMTIPTMYDPTLAPEGRHIMGIFLQYAPYTLKDSNWERERIRYTERILDVIEEYCPNIRSIIEHKQTLDAARSGTPLRHHRRQYFSRRNVAGPDVRAAAPGRLGALSDAGPRPVFVRLRRASRRRRHGRARDTTPRGKSCGTGKLVLLFSGHAAEVPAAACARLSCFTPPILRKRPSRSPTPRRICPTACGW